MFGGEHMPYSKIEKWKAILEQNKEIERLDAVFVELKE